MVVIVSISLSPLLIQSCPALLSPSLFVTLGGLEGHLQDLVSKSVAVETGDSHGRLFVVRHGNEAKALALVGVEISDHLDIGDGTKGPKHLPEYALVSILAQIVDEDATA